MRESQTVRRSCIGGQIMPIDKLIFLTGGLSEHVERMARDEGVKAYDYEGFVDFSKHKKGMPIQLFYKGLHGRNPIHKIVFVKSARLTFRDVRSILDEVCGKA